MIICGKIGFVKYGHDLFEVILPDFLGYLLTPWCRILFEKLIVTQLIKKNPVFFMEPEGSSLYLRSSPLDPILSQLNPVRPIDPYPPKFQLNVILDFLG
jgi:hypothetical protein